MNSGAALAIAGAAGAGLLLATQGAGKLTPYSAGDPGMGDYVNWFPCPYPAVVDQFNQVPPPVLVDAPCQCSAQGLGVFESGLNLGQWGVTEWAIVAGGLYLLVSAFNDTKRLSRRVGKSVRSSRARAARREKLKRELAEL